MECNMDKTTKMPAPKSHSRLTATLLIIMIVSWCVSGYLGYRLLNAPVSSVTKKLRFAGMTDSTKDDGGCGQAHYQIQQRLASRFKLETTFNESVARTDIEALYRSYAQQGYDIVGWWGFQGAEAAAKVGKEYPSKQFFFTCVQENGNNTFSFVYEEEQAGFLSGILAGLTTKTNKVGVYAGTNMPCANAYANAFELGVHLTNPNATVQKAYAGSWTDASKGKQTALTMINNGADFIAKYSNLADNGGMEACKENNVSTTGIYIDQAFMAPNQTLVSILWQTDAVASQLITNAIAGQSPIGAQMPVGFENGGFGVKYDPAYNNLSQKARTTFESWVSKVQIGMYKVPRVETPIY